MKKYSAYKIIQLVIFLVAAAISIYIVFFRSEIFHQAANDPAMKALLTILWILFILSFLFILLDFTHFFKYMRTFKEMEYASRSDPVSGLANRFSCDIFIEKYLDKPLPDTVGCLMFDLTNIRDINDKDGRLNGNMALRDFGNILNLCSEGHCFVGRNGGSKFLALFDNCDDKQIDNFIHRISVRVSSHNKASSYSPIEYKYGRAFNEGEKVDSITRLIALADTRITNPDA